MTSEKKRLLYNEYMRLWRLKNKERLAPLELERNRKWRERNPGKQTQNATNWKLKNREKVRESSRKWKKNNKNKVRKSENVRLRSKMYHLKRYNMTVSEYQEKFNSQKGVCAICNKPETFKVRKDGNVSKLSVDHDHTNGKIRDLLCRRCNQFLGTVEENTELLQSMIDYLNKHK